MSKTGVQQKRGQHFSQIPRADIPRSTFDRSSGLKMTLESSDLVPIFVDEALPGDTMNLSVSTFARMTTPLHPIMDNQYLDLFFFAVPMRLLWDNWAKFNGEQTNPGDSTDFLIPETEPPSGGYATNSLSDYFGLPTLEDFGPHSAMWHRAYNLIFNEWFRDENLVDSVTVNRDDGPDADTDYELLKRGKRHDYFTSCLPFPQKGPAVELSFGGTAPVDGIGGSPTFHTDVDATVRGLTTFDSTSYPAVSTVTGAWRIAGATGGEAIEWEDTQLQADLSAATGQTINAIRQAFQIQRLYERDARGGTRLTEIVRSHFGVTSPDARMQRPEYLGGGSTGINVTVVPYTTFEPNITRAGTLGGFVTGGGQGRGFIKSFTEHCVIIGLANLRADLTYQQGLPRMFSRSTRWDFYWPALSHLGEQSVLNKEIFADGSGNDDLVFGYQERFAEYRYKQSVVTGSMRSNATTSLDTWHLAQDFASVPLLNDTFISEDVPTDRVIAVTNEPTWLLDAWFQYKCVRPMPTYSVPGLVDHF